MVISRPFSSWSPGVRRQLRALTLREESAILDVLRDEPDVQTFVRFKGYKVVSWGLYSFAYAMGYATYMTFTRRSERGKGYGSEVWKTAKSWKRENHYHAKALIFDNATQDGKRFFARRYRF